MAKKVALSQSQRDAADIMERMRTLHAKGEAACINLPPNLDPSAYELLKRVGSVWGIETSMGTH